MPFISIRTLVYMTMRALLSLDLLMNLEVKKKIREDFQIPRNERLCLGWFRNAKQAYGEEGIIWILMRQIILLMPSGY